MPEPTADIGLIGLAVMGENLVLNMESHGFTVAVFNRTTSKVDDFVNGRGKGKKLVGAGHAAEATGRLSRRRRDLDDISGPVRTIAVVRSTGGGGARHARDGAAATARAVAQDGSGVAVQARSGQGSL